MSEFEEMYKKLSATIQEGDFVEMAFSNGTGCFGKVLAMPSPSTFDLMVIEFNGNIHSVNLNSSAFLYMRRVEENECESFKKIFLR